MYDKDSIDARTFPQVWGSLSPAEQEELRYQLVRSGVCTRQSIWNWSRGGRPQTMDVRRRISAMLNRHLKIKTTQLTLFPN